MGIDPSNNPKENSEFLFRGPVPTPELSQLFVIVTFMEFTAMDEAIQQIEKSNIDLEPEV